MALDPTPRIRVVVLNWNSAWFTSRCVRSLLATDWPRDRLEVVVVDNGSVDGSLELLEYRFPEVRFVRNRANLGFAEGCNRAMRDLESVDHVALVNNDAVVDPGWLRPLVRALESDPAVGAAAVRLVLEPLFIPVEMTVEGGSVQIESVLVGGIDATTRTQFVDTRPVGDVYWPMDITHHVDGKARLMVPAGSADTVADLAANSGGEPNAAGDREVALTLRGRGSLTVATESTEQNVKLDGSGIVVLKAGRDRVELINGLGTDRGEDSEGFDRYFGRPASDLADRDGGGPVPGFCGGGVLLRAEMLRHVGLFDPRFFAYYEDMDLSWRATRAGWGIVAVPDSVVRHAFGGSGGSANPAFFFLNYRNWLITVLRNGDRSERGRAFRSAWDRIKWAVRSNILSPLRHGSQPRMRLTLAWGRVVVAVILAAPRVRFGVRRGARPGARATTTVRGVLQPESSPGPTRPRPGGPLNLYVDVTEWFDTAPVTPAASDLLVGLLRTEAMIDVLPVRRIPGGVGLRRLHAAEMGRVLGVSGQRVAGTDATGGAVDELFRVDVDTPGAALIELGADGVTRLEGQAFLVSEGEPPGVAEALLARFGTP